MVVSSLLNSQTREYEFTFLLRLLWPCHGLNATVPCAKLTKRIAIALIGCLDLTAFSGAMPHGLRFSKAGDRPITIDGGWHVSCMTGRDLHDRDQFLGFNGIHPTQLNNQNRITAPPTLADEPMNRKRKP